MFGFYAHPYTWNRQGQTKKQQPCKPLQRLRDVATVPAIRDACKRNHDCKRVDYQAHPTERADDQRLVNDEPQRNHATKDARSHELAPSLRPNVSQ